MLPIYGKCTRIPYLRTFRRCNYRCEQKLLLESESWGLVRKSPTVRKSPPLPYWLASFGKHLCFHLSNFKLLTSSSTHHPRFTKANLKVKTKMFTEERSWVSCTGATTSLTPGPCGQLYLSLFWPHLDYAAQIWDPHLQCDINSLESMQRFALKVCSKQ